MDPKIQQTAIFLRLSDLVACQHSTDVLHLLPSWLVCVEIECTTQAWVVPRYAIFHNKHQLFKKYLDNLHKLPLQGSSRRYEAQPRG